MGLKKVKRAKSAWKMSLFENKEKHFSSHPDSPKESSRLCHLLGQLVRLNATK